MEAQPVPAPATRITMEMARVAIEQAGLSLEEAGACLFLLTGGAALPEDDCSLSNLSRLGPKWFRRPRGSDQTHGERIRQVLAAVAVAVPAGRAPRSRREQCRAAANARWGVHRGRPRKGPSGQMEMFAAPELVPDASDAFASPTHMRTHQAVENITSVASATHPDASPIDIDSNVSICNTEIESKSVLRKPPDEVEPALLPVDVPEELEWIRRNLHRFVAAAGLNWDPPDDIICRRVHASMGAADTFAVRELLYDKRRRGLFPRENYGWFVTVIAKAFSPRSAGPVRGVLREEGGTAAGSGMREVQRERVGPPGGSAAAA